MIITPIRIGIYAIYPLLDGYFWLDRALMVRAGWNERLKVYPADPQDRIKLAARCFLVVRKGAKPLKLLFDTGIGNPLDPAFVRIGNQTYRNFFGIDQKGGNLINALARAGFAPKDINIVTQSHLHLDHTGWHTKYHSSHGIIPVFKNAEYLFPRLEWSEKLWGHDGSLASYRKDAFLPVEKAGQAEITWKDHHIEPGLRLINTGGHTPGHWVLFVESAGETAVMAGDLIPTHKYINPKLMMSYDLNHLETGDKKKELLENAAQYGWLILFDHDPEHVGGYVVKSDGRFKFLPLIDP